MAERIHGSAADEPHCEPVYVNDCARRGLRRRAEVGPTTTVTSYQRRTQTNHEVGPNDPVTGQVTKRSPGATSHRHHGPLHGRPNQAGPHRWRSRCRASTSATLAWWSRFWSARSPTEPGAPTSGCATLLGAGRDRSATREPPTSVGSLPKCGDAPASHADRRASTWSNRSVANSMSAQTGSAIRSRYGDRDGSG